MTAVTVCPHASSIVIPPPPTTAEDIFVSLCIQTTHTTSWDEKLQMEKNLKIEKPRAEDVRGNQNRTE